MAGQVCGWLHLQLIIRSLDVSKILMCPNGQHPEESKAEQDGLARQQALEGGGGEGGGGGGEGRQLRSDRHFAIPEGGTLLPEPQESQLWQYLVEPDVAVPMQKLL